MIPKRLGLVGARGHVGKELLTLLADHPGFALDCASSRALAGQPVAQLAAGHPGGLSFEELSPPDVASRDLDAVVLALPNGLSDPFVAAIDATRPDTVIVDLSADHRFTDSWTYGWPERYHAELLEARRIANPGCYATGMQIALWPLVQADLLAPDRPPSIFGVSGYSGAGTQPSARNDPSRLEGNLMPYGLIGHTHEREVSRQLGRPVHFTPHVAPFFRGISLTLNVQLRDGSTVDAVRAAYAHHFSRTPLVRFVDDAVPEIIDHVGQSHASVGGLHHDPDSGRMTVVVALDNLLKGAASQALQNLNLACGHEALLGIHASADARLA